MLAEHFLKVCAPGVAWSVDGRTMNRAQLLAEAADRNARAMQRLGQGIGAGNHGAVTR